MADAVHVAIRDAVGDDDAFYVGGCVRDALLDRPVLDIDVACTEPAAAAARFRRTRGTAIFELSERFQAWRVLTDDNVTVDFVALRGQIEDDLRLRDFTANAIARRVASDAYVDPLRGVDDIQAGVLRALSAGVFVDDPLRLLRAVRLEDELPLAIDLETAKLVKEHAHRVSAPAGERVLAELRRLSLAGFARLAELGLLAGLGGSPARLGHLGPTPSSELLLVATLGPNLLALPVDRRLARMTRVLVSAEPPVDNDRRSIHRFRRATEPWSTDTLRYLDEPESIPFVSEARELEPALPLLRGDELGIEPGPEVGRLLELIAEERAAGTISTRDDALALVARFRP